MSDLKIMKLRCGKIINKKNLSKLNKQQKSVVFFYNLNYFKGEVCHFLFPILEKNTETTVSKSYSVHLKCVNIVVLHNA